MRKIIAFPILFIALVIVSFVWQDNDLTQALKIHEEVLTIDTHCDIPSKLIREKFDLGTEHSVSESQFDLPRMEKGGLDACFFSIFTSQNERIQENYKRAYEIAHQMIDSVNSSINHNSERAELALNSSDAKLIAIKGKRAIYMGMENGFPIGTNINRVKEFYDRGVRYITLAHSRNNDISDSSTDDKGPEHNGLSEFGKVVVDSMNSFGMMVDVSHISDSAFYDVLELTKAPIIASHSSVRAICDHPRNMSDDMIKALAKNGGVIQICLLGAYIKVEDTTTLNYKKKQELRKKYNNWNYASDEERKKAWSEWRQVNKDYPPVLPTIADAVDHIDHVVKLVGIDFVGIGSDFDGGGGLADCVDVSQFPKITEELYKRGYSKNEIAKIWGENFLRVFKAVEEIAN